MSVTFQGNMNNSNLLFGAAGATRGRRPFISAAAIMALLGFTTPVLGADLSTDEYTPIAQEAPSSVNKTLAGASSVNEERVLRLSQDVVNLITRYQDGKVTREAYADQASKILLDSADAFRYNEEIYTSLVGLADRVNDDLKSMQPVCSDKGKLRGEESEALRKGTPIQKMYAEFVTLFGDPDEFIDRDECIKRFDKLISEAEKQGAISPAMKADLEETKGRALKALNDGSFGTVGGIGIFLVILLLALAVMAGIIFAASPGGGGRHEYHGF